jgi:holo-[acyl-carrier protein] synthase
MILIGIGLDVVEVSRIRSSLDEFGERFLRRIFTATERAYCEAQNRAELHFAARFAAKEAISKAFGTGIGSAIGWLDLEVGRKPSGEPEVHLRGGAAALAGQRGVEQVLVSLTHARDYAAANAVLLG